MLVYIFVFLLAVFYLHGSKLNQNKFLKINYLVVVFGFLLFFACLRDKTVGYDLDVLYSYYYPFFKKQPWSDLQMATSSGHWEWGYCALCKILSNINDNAQFFILISSILSIFPYALFIYRNSNDVRFSTIFYISFNIYMMSLNIVRQAIAIGIVLVAVDFLLHRRILLFLLFGTLASLFHTSAIIIIVLFPLYYFKYKRFYLFLMLVGASVFAIAYKLLFQYLFLASALSDQYGFYEVGSGHAAGFITFHTVVTFVIALFIFLLYERTTHKHIATEMVQSQAQNIILYGLALACIFRFVAFYVNVTSRLSYYFIPLLLIAYPQVVKDRNIKIGKRFSPLLYLCLTFYFLFIGFMRAEYMWQTVPYVFTNVF